MAFLLRQDERRNNDLLIEIEQRAIFQELLHYGERLGMIHGEQALIEMNFRGQGVLVAQRDVQERELRNVAAEHDDADGQRRRKDQAGIAPQDGPKNRADQQTERRDSGVGSVEPGFHEIADDHFEDEE